MKRTRPAPVFYASARERHEALVWSNTHADYRCVDASGVRSILVHRSGGTTVVPVPELTEAEIACRLPRVAS